MQQGNEDRAEQLIAAQASLQKGHFERGLSQAGQILAAAPDDSDALYIAAVACRYLQKFDDAQGYLASLHAAMPEFGRAWQEAGHLARARGDTGTAITAFRRATQFNPALKASWKALAELARQAGGHAEAAMAEEQLARVSALPPHLMAVTNHLHEGRLAAAEEICRAWLQKHPKDTEGMRLLADIGMRMGILDDAEFLLESALEFNPHDIQIRLDYMQVLRRRQQFEAAREQAERLYNIDPQNPLFASHLAIESMQTSEFERAFALFDQVLAKVPNDPATLTSKGHALKTTGKQEEAVSAYRAAIAAKPDHGDAWYALANLKTWRFQDSDIGAMRAQLQRPELAFMDKVHLSFAMAKALEDRGEYEESFGHYRTGNELKRRQARYDAEMMTRELQAQADHCTPDLFARHAGSGHDAPDPIFILGLPRAGSTLLEQILASHSQIDGTLELPNILALAHRLRGRKAGQSRYPQVLHELEREQLEQFGRDFIENTRIHRQGAPFFIDKMPNNFRHIGLIQLILPNAKIIDARRAPMDCCFSGFKQLFAEGQEFTYGLHEVGRYYADYVALMEHWDTVLPGKVLRVSHEDVLDDVEAQTRRILEFLGMPFEDACLDFHKTERAVRTASSEQVRRPINRSGQDAWKPFEPWLDPLKAALGDLAP